MSKETKKKMLPKLRFPEFSDLDDWEEQSIEKIAPLQRGFDLPSEQIMPGNIPIVYSNGIQNYHAKGMAKAPGLLTGRSGTIGKIHFIEKGDYWPHNTTLWVTNFKNNVPKFIYYLYCSIAINRFATGSGVPTLNRNDVHAFRTYIPITFLEQQKIADCLSSLDDLITAQNEKLEILKKHKKGLMQQLFPTQGETLPTLRFLEFQNDIDWEETTLYHIAAYENGKAHENDIVENGAYIVVNSKFISTDGDVKKFTNTPFCIARIEEILMVLSDVPNGRAIAKCFFVDADNLYTVNQRICKISSNIVVSKLLFYLIDRNPYFLAFDDGVKQTNLKKEDVLNCPLTLSKNIDEQKKIADCLSSLDELITAQTQKIELLKQHKKGLMQQLFPHAGDDEK